MQYAYMLIQFVLLYFRYSSVGCLNKEAKGNKYFYLNSTSFNNGNAKRIS